MNCFLLAAVTADGFIGRHPQDRSFDWTSSEDKQFYVTKIKEAGVVIMGSQTFKTFSRYPKGLTFVIYTRDPNSFVNPKPEVITTIPTADSPESVLNMLEEKGYSKVAICGGSSMYTMFAKSGLIQKMYLTVEPILFGKGVGLFSEAFEQQLRLVKTSQLSQQTLLLEYDVLATGN